MQEEWKRLNYRGEDLGDFYLISNFGEIKGVKTGKMRRKTINHEGYYQVSISLGSRSIKPTIKIHIAVADTFIGNIEGLVVNHIDGNKLNNNVKNLEFCTSLENYNHAIRTGLLVLKRKKVIQLNKDLSLIINTFNSSKEAIRLFNGEKYAETISCALSKSKKSHYAYGYMWYYEEDLKNVRSL